MIFIGPTSGDEATHFFPVLVRFFLDVLNLNVLSSVIVVRWWYYVYGYIRLKVNLSLVVGSFVSVDVDRLRLGSNAFRKLSICLLDSDNKLLVGYLVPVSTIFGCINNQCKPNLWLQQKCFEHAPKSK